MKLLIIRLQLNSKNADRTLISSLGHLLYGDKQRTRHIEIYIFDGYAIWNDGPESDGTLRSSGVLNINSKISERGK